MFQQDLNLTVRARALRSTLLFLALGSLAAAAAAHGPNPIAVTAHFLSLSEDQLAQVVVIEQVVQQASAPVVQEIAQRRSVLDELIASGEADPEAVGNLVLSIHALQQQLVAIRQEAAGQIREILDTEQLDRLEAASEAQPVCRFVPALAALHLIEVTSPEAGPDDAQ